MPPIKNIKEVTEPLKKQILKGDVHTIDEIESVASVAIAFVLAVLLKEIENLKEGKFSLIVILGYVRYC